MSTLVNVPDLGVDQAEVIELLVKPGDVLKKDQPIAVLESDKASLELPATEDGVLVSWSVKIGDTVKVGDALLQFDAASGGGAPVEKPAEAASAVVEEKSESPAKQATIKPPVEQPAKTAPATPVASDNSNVYAGPAVRRLARELGVGLGAITGSGPKRRILKEDVHEWVKAELSKPRGSGANTDLPPEPDYSKWGEVELQPRSRIQRKSAENLARSANIVPQVTQFDEADITELETFRLSLKDRFKAEGLSLTMTALVAKTVAYLLQEMPAFNSSLSRDGENLVLKQYVNLGIAVDTPSGLLVPVLHNADSMGLRELSARLGELAEQARTGKLPPAAMQGASFTISSLGGIGGTAFTPLVNWPEVGILGLSRAQQKPVWDGNTFVPKLMLPLSLSYDHRVIDGASAARFTARLSQLLADVRQLLV
jgi:pyruvate dehydrogenase E2 component (dihydrolipoamide acetyltransferase)